VSFYIGLDLGQAADFTALAVLEAVSAEEVERGLHLHLRYLERYPLRTYGTTAGRASGVEMERHRPRSRNSPGTAYTLRC
jgi:hypothetical protein